MVILRKYIGVFYHISPTCSVAYNDTYASVVRYAGANFPFCRHHSKAKLETADAANGVIKGWFPLLNKDSQKQGTAPVSSNLSLFSDIWVGFTSQVCSSIQIT